MNRPELHRPGFIRILSFLSHLKASLTDTLGWMSRLQVAILLHSSLTFVLTLKYLISSLISHLIRLGIHILRVIIGSVLLSNRNLVRARLTEHMVLTIILRLIRRVVIILILKLRLLRVVLRFVLVLVELVVLIRLLLGLRWVSILRIPLVHHHWGSEVFLVRSWSLRRGGMILLLVWLVRRILFQAKLSVSFIRMR